MSSIGALGGVRAAEESERELGRRHVGREGLMDVATLGRWTCANGLSAGMKVVRSWSS